jgi:hypothetical protein
MATIGYIDILLNTLEPTVKGPIKSAFDYLLSNWRLGDGVRAENAQWYKFESTTASVANTEFSIHHGLNQKPSKLIPILDLNTVGSQLVPLVASRAPDAQRVYLKSSSTSAVFTCLLEV